MKDDTIVAIATPPGEGGIGVIRLSGADAPAIGGRLFVGRMRDRRAVFGHIADPETGDIVDEALAILMLAPRTYTREDTVELQTHGSTIGLQRILELAFKEGARAAEPGEFTLRAFLNGRIDLAQAEAVLDIVKARTDASLRIAVDGLGGKLSLEIRSLRAQLLDILGYLSARADFPDEDVPASNIGPDVERCMGTIESLLETADYGLVHRQGLRVAITGSPNVGKSSLMNRLLRVDRVIVTPIAGTTRDTVEESLNIGGIPILLMDTAGIEEANDPVEQIGVARARAAITRSDALLFVLDGTRALLHSEAELLSETSNRPRLIVLNKSDLPSAEHGPAVGPNAIRVSALTGEGISGLEQALSALALSGKAPPADSAIVANPRHKAALARALRSLEDVRNGLVQRVPEDMLSIDLRLAIESLGEITGDAITEDLLDTIFKNFCIGK